MRTKNNDGRTSLLEHPPIYLFFNNAEGDGVVASFEVDRSSNVSTNQTGMLK